MIGNTTRLVRSLPGTFYTVTEAAELVGKSSRTLRRWAASDEALKPSYVYQTGGLVINLYTPDDIVRLKIKADNKEQT